MRSIPGGSWEKPLSSSGERLKKKNIIATLEETTIRAAVRGESIWVTLVDGLLKTLSPEGLYCLGYADDLAIVVQGKLPSFREAVVQPKTMQN